jgi:hypothetical protein
MIEYTPPTTDDLIRLKDRLGKSSSEMAEYVGLSGGNQWRKYTGGAEPRNMGYHMLFHVAAREVLSDKQIEAIENIMRDIGAEL